MAHEIDDVIRVAMTGFGPQTTIWQNVWHLKMVVGAAVATADLIAAVVANIELMHAEIDQIWSQGYTMEEIELWEYNFVTSKWNGIGTGDLGGLAGLAAEDAIPHGAAAVGRFVNTVARRQGRTFLPGLIETAVDAGLLDANALVAFALYMAEFTNDLTPAGGTFKLCTFNTDQESVYYESTAVFLGPAIISMIPGYQRRRKPLVGL